MNYQSLGEGNDDDLMRRLDEEIEAGGDLPQDANLLEF